MTYTILENALTVAFTVILMEGVAYALHRYVMHGIGWSLHRSHHRPRRGYWEHNDLFGLFFAAISIALILTPSPYDAGYWIGIGIALYGLLYAILHDGFVHRRLPVWRVPRSGYVRRLIRAHHIHHITKTRDGAVAFGFLYAPSIDKITGRLWKRTGR